MSDNLEKKAEGAERLVGEDGQTVETSSGQVQIYKAKVKHTGDILKLISSVFKQLEVKDFSGVPKADMNNPQVLLTLIGENFEELRRVSSKLCSLSEQQIDDLDYDDFYTLLNSQWELNKDFFSKTLKRMFGDPAEGSSRSVANALSTSAQQERSQTKSSH